MRSIMLNIIGTFTGLLLLCLLLKNISPSQSESSVEPDSLNRNYPCEYNSNLNIELGKVNYYQAFDSIYQFSEEEKLLLQKSGMAVSGRMSYNDFGRAFYDIFQKELPVFLPADCFLYALHQSYNIILEDVETDLNPVLQSLLQKIINQAVAEKNSGQDRNPDYLQSLDDVIFYLQVA